MLESLIVNKPVINVFLQPKEDTEVHTQAFYSNRVHVLECGENSWRKIKMADNEEGWVKQDDLIDNRSYAADPNLRPVQSLFAHIYRVAETATSPPLMTLPFSANVKLIEGCDLAVRWIPIELASGARAWIQRGDLNFHPVHKSLDQMLRFAMKFIGLPYTWGGASSFGYDCSGFVQMLLREIGHIIPRNACDQISWQGFVPIEREGLQAGDLLFFGEGRINHVGLYLEQGDFLHAGVRDAAPSIGISNLATTKYTYAGARRIIY